MKRLLLFLVLTLALTFPGQIWAEDSGDNLPGDLTGKWGASIMLKGIFPQEDGLKNAVLWGGAFEYNFFKYMAVELETGYSQTDDEYEGLKLGTISFVPLLANLKVRYPEGRVNPFVYGGVGALFPHYEEAGWVKNLGVSLDVSPGLAYQVGGGIDVWIIDNLAFFVKGGYLWSEVKAEVRGGGLVIWGDVNANHVFAGGGIKGVF